MAQLPTLADRVWFALHCLPRDKRGQPPSMASLEKRFGLANGTLSKTVSGARTQHQYTTMGVIASALQVSEHWLRSGGNDSPIPTGPVPPRPGTLPMRYGDVAGWREAVNAALLEPVQVVPPEAFRAGADMVVQRALDHVSPSLAIGVSYHAWFSITPREQDHYSLEEARGRSSDKPSGKHKTGKIAKRKG